ncbi:MAG TPA: succinylglutamate desuccinylase/aspartoacylase family protein [Roseiflexaceae bacterium]
MSDILTVGPLSAERGRKVRGWAPVTGTAIRLPLTVAHGADSGPTLLVTGGIHGGEYPGIEAAIGLACALDPGAMRGSVIVAHIASPTAFQARMQYRVPEDGLNLNRQFPGNATGTVSQRLAAFIIAALAARADAWVDLHGGDIHEELEPFTIYSAGAAPAVREQAARLAQVYGIRYLLESDSVRGATYGAAAAAGIPCILTEAGGVGQLEAEAVDIHSRGLQNVLRELGILPGAPAPAGPTVLLRENHWMTSEHTGCWYPAVRAGEQVSRGQPVGELRDYFGEQLARVVAPSDGVVLFRVTSLAVDAGDPLLAIGAA